MLMQLKDRLAIPQAVFYVAAMNDNYGETPKKLLYSGHFVC